MGNIRQSGVGIPWQLPAADHSVACWTNKAPENGVWMQRSQKLNTFCYVTSSFDLDFMHACHDYIIFGHGEPISQIMWIMTRRCLISAVVGCMLPAGCTLCTWLTAFLFHETQNVLVQISTNLLAHLRNETMCTFTVDHVGTVWTCVTSDDPEWPLEVLPANAILTWASILSSAHSGSTSGALPNAWTVKGSNSSLCFAWYSRGLCLFCIELKEKGCHSHLCGLSNAGMAVNTNSEY